MPKKTYIVNLTEEESTYMHNLFKGGKHPSRKLTRARVLLLANKGKSDETISEVLHIGIATVGRIRKKFVEGGIELALNEHPRPGAECKLDGKQEAFLIALACSNPPEGRKAWTMQLLADKLVELGVTDPVSDETVRRILKKKTLSHGLKSNGVFLQ